MKAALAALMLAASLAGCGTLEDCGGAGGVEVPKIRSSSVRMVLADVPAAAARFAPYAAMSALVYDEAAHCRHPRVAAWRDELLALLRDKGWAPYTDGPALPGCDDDQGMFVRVWRRQEAARDSYVIVFRGTGSGLRDWVNGNLWWVTRYFRSHDQYTASREYAGRLITHLKAAAASSGGRQFTLASAGHSLGGGLAQNVLYSFPDDVLQAYAFDPSPVTAYSEQDEATRRKGCDCQSALLGPEARVYRIYETQEVLSWLRYLLKVVLPLNRQIQEVRFNFGDGHSMADLAHSLLKSSQQAGPTSPSQPWWRGRDGGEARQCTALYRERLQASCGGAATTQICPR